jgi:hypothetical protein
MELSDPQFKRLMIKDIANGERWEPVLSTELEKIPTVLNVDYNGHFGANVYYTIEMSPDIVKINKEVKRLIKKWVQK